MSSSKQILIEMQATLQQLLFQIQRLTDLMDSDTDSDSDADSDELPLSMPILIRQRADNVNRLLNSPSPEIERYVSTGSIERPWPPIHSSD